MNKPDISRFRRNVMTRGLVVAAVFAGLFVSGQPTRAADWHSIEPLKSRRADVERELGQPLLEEIASGALNFKVAGGIVTVSFVTPKFIQTKKLSPDLEGTVLLIVLRHDNSTDTPESLDLGKKSNFTREEKMALPSITTARTASPIPSSTGDLRPHATPPPPSDSCARKEGESKG